MDTVEFGLAVEVTRDRDPVLFGLPSEGPMSEQEIEGAEAALGIALPERFKWFLGRFGAGHFALVVIYSLVSRWMDSAAAVRELPWLDPKSFLPVVDIWP